MKILHVFKTALPFSQGGLEEAIRQICRATAERASQVDVACVGPRGHAEVIDAGYARVLAFPAALRLSTCPVAPRMLPTLWRAFDAYDVVHLHGPWPFAELAALPRPGGRARRVVTYHADIVNRELLAAGYRPLLRRLLDGCDAVVATSAGYVRSSPVLRRLRQRPHVIPLGLDPASYPEPDPERVAHWRTRVGEGVFLFLGALRYYKGLDELAEATRRAGVRTVVAGDGPGAARLAALSAGRDDLIRTGHIPDADKMALLRLARAVVLPSTQRAEAFGIALLEGAMCGRALISTRLGTGTDEVNRDGETGLVVPPGDAEALASAMAALDRDPARAARFGAAAARRFRQHYTGAAMGQAYGELYARLTHTAPAAAPRPAETRTGTPLR